MGLSSTTYSMQRSAHCIAGGHKQCRGLRLGQREGHWGNTLVPCECGCHSGTGTREVDRLRVECDRLIHINAELNAECDQWSEKVADCWRQIERLTAAWKADLDALRAEIERQKDENAGHAAHNTALVREIHRLQALVPRD